MRGTTWNPSIGNSVPPGGASAPGVSREARRESGEDRTRALSSRVLSRWGGPAWSAYHWIARRWGLSDSERALVLGTRAPLAGAHQLDAPMIVRVGGLLTIHRLLLRISLDTRIGARWLRMPNRAPVFAGHAPLSLLCSTNPRELFVVRDYLAAYFS